MISSILHLFVLGFFIAFSSKGNAQSFSIHYSIDENIYKELNDTQKSSLQNKIQEINKFITSDLESIIPEFIKEKIKNLEIKITLSREQERDGLFIPNAEGAHTISIPYIRIYNNGLNALIAHEIYHAIHFHLNPNEEPWVREGMAQVFEYLTTGELNGMNLFSAIKNPLTPLIGKYSITDKNPAQYGHNMLYFYYLYKQCGKDKLFWKLTEGNPEKKLKGSELINHLLQVSGEKIEQCLNFRNSAITFEVAKVHNQVTFSNQENSKMYFIYPGDITPNFVFINDQTELNKTINELPILSGFRLSMTEENSHLSVNCTKCQTYFAEKSFPYLVTKKLPQNAHPLAYDIIIIKEFY